MTWKLELVRSDDCGPPQRLTVRELKEIDAPANLDGVGVDLVTSHNDRTVAERRDGLDLE